MWLKVALGLFASVCFAGIGNASSAPTVSDKSAAYALCVEHNTIVTAYATSASTESALGNSIALAVDQCESMLVKLARDLDHMPRDQRQRVLGAIRDHAIALALAHGTKPH
jgi:hypothetical protein